MMLTRNLRMGTVSVNVPGVLTGQNTSAVINKADNFIESDSFVKLFVKTKRSPRTRVSE